MYRIKNFKAKSSARTGTAIWSCLRIIGNYDNAEYVMGKKISFPVAAMDDDDDDNNNK